MKSLLKCTACMLSLPVISTGSPSAADEKDLVDTAVAAGSSKTPAPAINRKATKLESKDGAFYMNDSKVTTADAKCPNGVIHIIGAVLLPPAEKNNSYSSQHSR